MDLLARAQTLEKSSVSIVHMEVGEPDFPTPPKMIEAATQTLATGQVKYTAAAGILQLREKIAEHYSQQYQLAISTQRIFVTPGASGAFILAMSMLVNPGNEVLLPDPCYPCNRNFIHLFEGHSKLIAVDGATEYQLTADLLRHHWSETTCGTIIASPSNPTGTIMSAQQLQSVIDWVDNQNGWIVSDEIYHGLVYGADVNSALEFSNDALVINSFSKYFGMTGWRLGWLVVPDALIEAAEKLAQSLFISASTIAQAAAIHAFDSDNLQLLETRQQQFQARRDFLYDALLSLGFSIQCKPQGAFYIYAGCEQFSDDSDLFASELLEKSGVAVTPGRDFGEHQASSHIRFAYTTSLENLQLGVERIARFISR
jgi:aspartate/methionine/tyrosine aminotransferase